MIDFICDFIYGTIKIAFAIWCLVFIVELLFGVELIVLLKRYVNKEKKLANKKIKPRLRISEGSVYHVNSLDGRQRIIHAANKDKALSIAAKAMAVEESELVVEEVYDKVLR